MRRWSGSSAVCQMRCPYDACFDMVAIIHQFKFVLLLGQGKIQFAE